MAFVAVIKFVYTKPLTEAVLTEVLNIEAGFKFVSSRCPLLGWDPTLLPVLPAGSQCEE